MNWKLICVEVLAIAMGYLVFSITPAFAANVKVYYNGALQGSVTYNPQSYVYKSVAMETGNVRVIIANGTSSVSVDKVHIYSCKGLAPTACAAGTPETYNGSMNMAYPWSSVADQTSGYPQKATFLILVKVRSAEKIFWTGFWQTVERIDASTYTPYESRISEVQVNAKSIDYVMAIKNYVTANNMIPFNPQWVTSVVFPGASGLNLLKATLSEMDTPTITANQSSTNQIASIDQDCGLAIPTTSDSIFSPVGLRLNPSYSCGNANCESGLGETQSNCCLDCACLSGYYCDLGGGCKQASGITLSVYGTPQTAVSSCNQQHILNITVKINNPPTGLSISSASYKLGNASFQSTSCSGGSQTGYILSCPVTVPAVPSCNTGSYNVGPNYMNLSVTFTDGKGSATRYIAASFPNVVIGSFQCGNGNCESSLGESPSVCCYDCGCSSGYCDIYSPSNGSCRQSPVNTDLRISGITPSGFYTHSAGDSVRFNAYVANAPATLSVSGQSCSLSCSRSDSQACSAGCTITCPNTAGPGAYNASCSLGFSIPSYDPLKSYSLYPTLNLSASYTNGSKGSVQKVLSNSFATINIGSHWCGDRKCDPDESSGTCCYDCGCTTGYCDTKDPQYNSAGDSCKASPQKGVDSISTTVFSGTYDQHIINITGRLGSRPSGISLTPSCTLGGRNGIACYVTCEPGSDPQVYTFLCQMYVPSLDYNSSSFFDVQTRKVTFPQNSLNLTFSFNNGSLKAQETYSVAIPDVVIAVTPKCGNAVCEANVGESKSGCCIDCYCSRGNFCYTGKTTNGECLSNTALTMRTQSVDANPAKCIISVYGKQCSFTQAERMYLTIMNPPAGMQIEDAYYKVSGSDNYTSLGCKAGEGEGNYSCAFTLERPSQTTPGEETKTLEAKMTLAYVAGGAVQVKNVSDTYTFKVTRVYSEAVSSCIAQEHSLDRKIKNLKSDKTLYTVLAVIFFIISLIFWIWYFVCVYSSSGTMSASCESWKTYAIIAGVIGGCGLSYVLSKLQEVEGKINSLEQEKNSICVAEGFGQLSSSTKSSSNWVYTIGSIYGSITCMMSVSSGISGVSGGTNTGPSKGSWLDAGTTTGTVG
jgi:hypothetical protein